MLIGAVLIFFALNRDLWNDEIYSLKYFVLVPINTTLSDYVVPNNHIFSNLLYNLYFKIIGYRDIGDILYNPWVLRLLGIGIGMVSLVFQYKLSKNLLGKTKAKLGILLTLCSIVFVSFGMDQRGYALSIALVSVLYYFLFTRVRFRIVFITIISGLLVVTVPSNLIFLVSIICIYIIHYIWGMYHKSIPKAFIVISDVLWIMAGIVLAIIYFHIFHLNVFNNKYAQHHESFSILYKLLYTANVIVALGSWNLLCILITLFISFRQKKVYNIILNPIVFVSIGSLIIALSINTVFNVMGPARIFSIWIIPIHIAIILLLDYLLLSRNKALISVLSVMAIFLFSIEISIIRNHIQDETMYGHKPQDLYRQYYLWDYHPIQTVQQLMKMMPHSDTVALIGAEDYDLPIYLEEKAISYRKYENDHSKSSKEKWIISNSIIPIYHTGYNVDDRHYHKLYYKDR